MAVKGQLSSTKRAQKYAAQNHNRWDILTVCETMTMAISQACMCLVFASVVMRACCTISRDVRHRVVKIMNVIY